MTSLWPQSLDLGSFALVLGILGSRLKAGLLSGDLGPQPCPFHHTWCQQPSWILRRLFRAGGWEQLVESGPWKRDKPEQAHGAPLPCTTALSLLEACFSVMGRLLEIRSQEWIPDLPLQPGPLPPLPLPVRACPPRGRANTGRPWGTSSGNMALAPGSVGASFCGRRCSAPRSGGLGPCRPGWPWPVLPLLSSRFSSVTQECQLSLNLVREA